MLHKFRRLVLSLISLLLVLAFGCGQLPSAESSHSIAQYRDDYGYDSATPAPESVPISSEAAAPESSSSQESTPEASSQSQAQSVTPAIEAYKYSGSATGFTLSLGDGGDISVSGLSDAQIQDKLDEAVKYAANRRLHTIYLQVRGGAKALYKSEVFDPMFPGVGFDILEYLCVAAAAQGIQVFAVADMLLAYGDGLSASNPATQYASALLAGDGKLFDPHNAELRALLAQSVGELAAYPVAGIILGGLDLYGVDSPSGYADGISALIKAAAAKVGSIQLGILFDAVEQRGVTTDTVSALTADGTVDALYLVDYSGVDYYYGSSISRWVSANTGAVLLYTVNAAYKVTSDKFSSAEMTYQALINSTRSAVDGTIFDSYADLVNGAVDFNEVAGIIAEDSVNTIFTSTDLSFEQSLRICFPPNDSYTTTAAAIYVMGTSNPGQGLTVNGSEVNRQGYKGCFGVKIDLASGNNVITLRNGDKTAKVTVTRSSAGAVSKIDYITSASRFPAADVGILTGKTFSFSCVGPAGAEITASVGGQSVTMKQAVAGVTNGIAATYKGSFTLSSSGDITELGKVKYTLRYNGATTTYNSEGSVFAVGSSNALAVKVSDYHGNVISDYTTATSIVGTMKEGSLVSITGCEVASGKVAYKLKDGNFITSDCAAFYPKLITPSYTVSGGSSSGSGRDYYISLATGSPSFIPAVTSSRGNGKLTLKLYGGSVASLPDVTGCKFVSGAAAGTFNAGATLTLTLANTDDLWGYNIEYDDNNNIRLHFRSNPHLSDEYGKPLSGIKIVLDPGHSGDDVGAFGITNKYGPDELTMNLAIARAVKYRLELLGATVYLTHNGDSGRVKMDARCRLAEEKMCDIFLSLHHNSAETTKDHASSNWMETYYYYSASKQLALNLLSSVHGAIGRSVKAAYQASYYVTRLTFAPAVLFEVGFVINPLNYEDCTDTVTIHKTACAIADAIMDSIPD